MLDIESLKKKYEEKKFPQQDCEYIVKIIKAIGMEADESKNKPYPTYLLHVEVLEVQTGWAMTPNTITQPGDINILGFKLSDQKRLNDLKLLCQSAQIEFDNHIFDNETNNIKGNLYGKIVRLKISMNQNWSNLKWIALTDKELSHYLPKAKVTFSDDFNDVWENQ